MMNVIYTKASRVIVWLGRGDPEIEFDAFDLILRTNSYLEDGISKHGKLVHVPLPPTTSRILDNISWVPVRKLFALNWFRRVWVLQEVGLAASAIVLYGSRTISWSAIVEIALFWDGYPALQAAADLHIGQFVDTFRYLWCSYDRQVSWKTESAFVRQEVANQDKTFSSSQFFNVLTCAIRYESSLECDKIYAFLGHPAARYGTGTIVEADYNRSGLEVCREVALKLMQSMNSLDVLSFVHDTERYIQASPGTWIPRWDSRYDIEKFCKAPGTKQTFDASRGLNSASQTAKLYDPLFHVSDSMLRVNGVIIDEIQSFSTKLQSSDFTCPTETLEHNGGRAMNPLERILGQVCDHCATSILRYSDRIEACRFTLTGGLDYTRNPAELDPVNFEADFYACVTEKCRGDILDRINLYTTPRAGEDHNIECGNSAHFLQALRVFTHNRRFFITRTGYYGLGPTAMHEGDLCCVFMGAQTPYVVRKTRIESQYELIGECYIQGLMRGEAVKNGQCKIEEINLV